MATATASKKGKAIDTGEAGETPAKKPTTKQLIEGVVGMEFSSKGKGKADTVAAVLPRKSITIEKDFNPRSKPRTKEELETLGANIKRDGLLHPIVVRPVEGKIGQYSVVAGEQRLRAIDTIEPAWETIPVVIRADLEGDTARAKAVAVAENSEEGRQNLTHIELGRAFQELQDKFSYTVAQISAETLVHQRTVRRCLELVAAPESVQKKVAAGTWSMGTALEVSKLDADVAKAIEPELEKVGGSVSAEEIKRLAKAAAKAQGAGGEGDGKPVQKKKGASRDAALTAWKPSKTKQAVLAELCAYLVGVAEADRVTGTGDKQDFTADYAMARGAVAYGLWDRGDLEQPLPPGLKPAEGDEPKAHAKALKEFDGLVKAEAKKYTPPADEGDEASE